MKFRHGKSAAYPGCYQTYHYNGQECNSQIHPLHFYRICPDYQILGITGKLHDTEFFLKQGYNQTQYQTRRGSPKGNKQALPPKNIAYPSATHTQRRKCVKGITLVEYYHAKGADDIEWCYQKYEG